VWAYLFYAGKHEGRKKLECWNVHVPAILCPNLHTCIPRSVHFHYFHYFIIFVFRLSSFSVSGYSVLVSVCLTRPYVAVYVIWTSKWSWRGIR
jgi:hypothetical protein